MASNEDSTALQVRYYSIAQLQSYLTGRNNPLSSITDFADIFDRDGRFLYANQPLLDLWGLKIEEAVGKNIFDLQIQNLRTIRIKVSRRIMD